MSHHEAHATHHALQHTSAGKQVVGAATVAAVGAAKIVGGATAAAAMTAAAPVLVPVAIAMGVGYLASKQGKKH